jgi:hypothetical protein
LCLKSSIRIFPLFNSPSQPIQTSTN